MPEFTKIKLGAELALLHGKQDETGSFILNSLLRKSELKDKEVKPHNGLRG